MPTQYRAWLKEDEDEHGKERQEADKVLPHDSEAIAKPQALVDKPPLSSCPGELQTSCSRSGTICPTHVGKPQGGSGRAACISLTESWPPPSLSRQRGSPRRSDRAAGARSPADAPDHSGRTPLLTPRRHRLWTGPLPQAACPQPEPASDCRLHQSKNDAKKMSGEV